MLKNNVPLAAPRLLSQLDEWTGEVDEEGVELAECTSHDSDFSSIKRLEVDGCRLTGTQMAGANLSKMQISDTILIRLEAAGMHAPEASWLRIATKDSRMTGADFGETTFEDCVFENVKFDEAGLRFAICKRVRFEDCVLRNIDFSGARLSNVSFVGCELEGANFTNALCKAVDLRGEPLTGLKGVHGLKGATISSEQLVQLAPLLASEVGLDVDYET